MMLPLRRSLSAALVSCAIAMSVLSAQGRGGAPQAPIDPLKFQFMGPVNGGRVAAIIGVPGDNSTWYLGNSSGGVWKSSDGGGSFKPMSDEMPVQAIGALAISQSDHNIVWAGTGEAWAIRDADVMGDGVYKSTDAGATWVNMGLRETGRIGRVIVHPTNPDIVFVCALGRATGPQQERGVYRTTDGGKNWQRVLFVDPNTGCSGLSIDLKDPNVLFAGMWQLEMHTWAMFSGGPSSALYVTRDGGTTWSRITSPGLPKSPIGKIDVAVAPSDGKRVYALIQTANQGSVWRSDDGGNSWNVASWARPLIGRAGYYIRIAVSSGNPDEIYIANSSFFRSLDGGKTFAEVPWGGDNHDIWVDPTNPEHIGTTDDGGARLSIDHGRTGTRITIANSQMYHVAVDNQVPYWIYTNRQDNSTMRGPSDEVEVPAAGRGGAPAAVPPRAAPTFVTPADSAAAAGRGGRGGAAAPDTTGGRGGRGNGGGGGGGAGGGRGGAVGFGAPFTGTTQWERPLGGCESGFTLPDPTNPDIVWASCYANTVTRYDARTKMARSVSPWIHTLDSPPTDTKYRCHWTPPLAIDPFDHNTVYYGCQVVFKTSNGGQSWAVISPDLSTHDSSRIVSSGGLVADNLGQFYGEVVFAIAPSSIQRGLIWAGTNDGKLWYTADGGKLWVDVSKNITGMPAWGTIRKIEPSHFSPGTAYVAVDFHMMDDRHPFLFKTTDFGKTWTKITGDLPADHPLSYVMSVAENPNRKGMLFAGTGNAFYYSMNDGVHWTRYAAGLPAAPVTWIEVPKLWHDVVVSTYGRGIYILHDITHLEESDKAKPDAAVTFTTPRPGYRLARSGQAMFTFTLAKVPAGGRVTLEILDSAGKTLLRSMTGNAHAGMNRVTWDLRENGPDQVVLKTLAPDNPHIWDEPRFQGRNTRAIEHWGIQGPQRAGPIAAPGMYTARLLVDSVPYLQKFKIIKDPALPATSADLVASSRTQIRIVADMNATVEMINRLETMRKQVEDQLKANENNADVTKALTDVGNRMMDVELKLVTRADLETDDKYYMEAYKVYLNLIWLYGEVGLGAGDVAGGADSRPTDASMQVLAMIEKDLASAKLAFTDLVDKVVPAFNAATNGKVPAITTK